jgi:hypothetical protein
VVFRGSDASQGWSEPTDGPHADAPSTGADKGAREGDEDAVDDYDKPLDDDELNGITSEAVQSALATRAELEANFKRLVLANDAHVAKAKPEPHPDPLFVEELTKAYWTLSEDFLPVLMTNWRFGAARDPEVLRDDVRYRGLNLALKQAVRPGLAFRFYNPNRPSSDTFAVTLLAILHRTKYRRRSDDLLMFGFALADDALGNTQDDPGALLAEKDLKAAIKRLFVEMPARKRVAVFGRLAFEQCDAGRFDSAASHWHWLMRTCVRRWLEGDEQSQALKRLGPALPMNTELTVGAVTQLLGKLAGCSDDQVRTWTAEAEQSLEVFTKTGTLPVQKQVRLRRS